jgi:hypothetical protein
LVRILILDEAPEDNNNNNNKEISEMLSLKPQEASTMDLHSLNSSHTFSLEFASATIPNTNISTNSFSPLDVDSDNNERRVTVSQKVDLDEEGEPIEEI